jgi:hypothetical protein
MHFCYHLLEQKKERVVKYYVANIFVWAILSAAAVTSATDKDASVPETKSPDNAADSATEAPPPGEADDSETEASPPEHAGDASSEVSPPQAAAKPEPGTEEASPPVVDDGKKSPCDAGGSPDGTACPSAPLETQPAEGREPGAADRTVTETAVTQTDEPPEKETGTVDSGPPDQRPLLSLHPDPALPVAVLEEYGHLYKRNRIMQTTGYSMLAVSFAMVVVGVIFTMAAPQDALGWSGFGIIGGGLLHYITSAFLLAYSVPPNQLPPPGHARRNSAAAIIFS